MAKCDVCGNDYDKAFQVTQGAKSMTFESFECAIHALARNAPIATAGSSVTASRRKARSTVVRIAPGIPAHKV
jgi:hypothetical protein